MSKWFWLKRFFVVLIGAFIIIAGAQWLKGNDALYAATHGAIWSLISAIIFTAARFYQSRRGQHCALCKDTPEMQRGSDRE